jgi:hypothetical protein
MSLRATRWAFMLTPKTAAAKLCAIWLSDNGADDGSGRVELDQIAGWCCLSVEATLAAFQELNRNQGVGWQLEDSSVLFQLPKAAWEEIINEVDPRTFLEASLYVMTGKHGVKIGVSRYVKARVVSLQMAMLDDTITLRWAYTTTEPRAFKAERLAHQLLADKRSSRLSAEWFTVEVQEAIDAATTALKQVG